MAISTGAKRGHRERGQSLTEFAISFLVLILLLAGTVDLGRAFFSYLALREAAEEGALYGSTNPADTSGIIQRVRTSSSAPVDLADTTNVLVDPVVSGGACAGNTLAVTVTYNFELTMPLIEPIIGTNQFPIALTATSTILRPEC